MCKLYNIPNLLRTVLGGIFFMVFMSQADAQIKIGTNGSIIAPSSLLELESANQGLLLPRLADTAAINALSPPNGMLIYLTKAPAVGLYVRKVTGWEYLTGSLAGNGNFNSLTVAGAVTAGIFRGALAGNASTATTVSGNVAVGNGGTGLAGYTPGDLIYADRSNRLTTLSALGQGGKVLRVDPVTGFPIWDITGAGSVTRVTGTPNRIVIENNDPSVAPEVNISPNYVGQTSITTLGTISNPQAVWNGTAVNAAHGGTGLTTLPNNVLVGNGIGNVTVPANFANVGYVLTSTGPNTAPTYQLPAGTGDMLTNGVQNVTGAKTFFDGTLILKGSGTGTTTLKSDPNFTGTLLLPAANSATSTLVGVDATQTLSNKSFSGTTTLATANITTSTITDFTVTNINTVPANTIITGAQAASAATDANTPSRIVRRDGNGDFAGRNITATGSFIGNVTGTSQNVTGTVAVINGGTGATTPTAGFNALSPMTTAGDIIYGGAAPAGTGQRLPIGAANTYLKSTGSAPTWGTINLVTEITGVANVLAPEHGGTGLNNGAANTIKLSAPFVINTGAGGIDFNDNAGNGASEDQTISAPGAEDGDVVSLGVPIAAMAPGVIYFAWVSAADSVTVRFTKISAGNFDPPNVTFNVKVFKK